VKLDNRIVTRLFGEISPKRGDLVFSKTGELIGMMVNSEYCAVLGDFTAATTLRRPGTSPNPRRAASSATSRPAGRACPLKLQ
jgi:hypothetical protein